MYIFSLILHVVEKYSTETWPYEGVTSFQHCKLNRGAESYFTVQYDRDLQLLQVFEQKISKKDNNNVSTLHFFFKLTSDLSQNSFPLYK